MNKKLVIYDFDGTLFDTYESLVLVYQRGFAAIGMECTKEECAHHMHHSLGETIMERKVPENLIPLFVEKIVDALDDDDVISLIKPFPETLDALKRCDKACCKLAIVTGNTTTHVHKVLKYYGWDEYFSCVIGSDICPETKPNPAPLNKALSSFPIISKEEAVYIGDSLQDLEAAKRAGIDSYLVNRASKEIIPTTQKGYFDLTSILNQLKIPTESK